MVYSVAYGVLDGHPIAVTSGSDKTVRVWDLTKGRPIGAPLTGHTDCVRSVACAVLDGHLIAVTGGSDGTMRAWDLTTRRLIDEPFSVCNSGSVWSVACGVLDGRPIAVAASDGGKARVWDLTQRQQFGEILRAKVVRGFGRFMDAAGEGASRARGLRVGSYERWHLACAMLDGRQIAVIGHSSVGKLWVWDLASLRKIGQPLTGHTDSVSVGSVRGTGRPIHRRHRQQGRHGAGVGFGWPRGNRATPHRPH